VHLVVTFDVAYVRVLPEVLEGGLGELAGDGLPDVAEVEATVDGVRGLLRASLGGGRRGADDVAVGCGIVGLPGRGSDGPDGSRTDTYQHCAPFDISIGHGC